MNIKENLDNLLKEIPDNLKLVAVSKTKPLEDILEAYDTGQRVFGENKAQELIKKYPELPKDIQWHFIGYLQTNKVKYLVPFVSMIQSVDRFKLLKEIDKHAGYSDRTIDCLLQFHIASEDTKFGLGMDEVVEILNSHEYSEMKNIRICGVMGMATFTNEGSVIQTEFRLLKNIFNQIKKKYFENADYFKEISMGMSGDYKIAIEEGSTIIRLGSAIFGERNFKTNLKAPRKSHYKKDEQALEVFKKTTTHTL